MSDRSDIDVAALKAELETQRETLASLARVTEESRAPVELDQATQGRLSRMDAIQQQAMALETGRRREIELMKIGSALARLDAGDYGYCVMCDEPIEAKRLELDPAVPTCLKCAES